MRLGSFPPADPSKKGLIRKILGNLGPSWLASPVRRCVQTAALLVFLALFLLAGFRPDSAGVIEARGAESRSGVAIFVSMDPLATLSAALATRTLMWGVVWAGGVLVVCAVLPRAFCAYVCPLGTLTDLFDWAVLRRFKRRRIVTHCGVRRLRYYLLAGVLLSALLGFMVSGFVAALPFMVRGLQSALVPVTSAVSGEWHSVSGYGTARFAAGVMLAGVLGLGLLGRRFWCRNLCPTGAMFSFWNTLRMTERRVTADCTHCARCVKMCDFDGINPDFTTRTANCTSCRTCAGACPTGSVRFALRWQVNRGTRPVSADATGTPVSRREFVVGGMASVAATMSVGLVFSGRGLVGSDGGPLRPPGSIPEYAFQTSCVRCGSCMNVCATGILQPLGLRDRAYGLWTPYLSANRAGCDRNCNRCGHACPTGAIRALPLSEKQAARIGLAVLDETCCLPHAGTGHCQLCAEVCKSAASDAIEFVRVHVEVDEEGAPVEDSGFTAPVVRADRCVGCGFCQMRCHEVNVRGKRLLDVAAIRVQTGPGREDRIMRGSYVALRQAERKTSEKAREVPAEGKHTTRYLPDFLE